MNKRIVLSSGLFLLVLLCSAAIYFYHEIEQNYYSHYAYYDDLASSGSLQQAADGQFVSLKGYLVKRLTKDTYLFKTEKHDVIVEIDDFVFPREAFSKNNLINIIGEVDRDFLEPVTVEVERIDVL